jgi:hypothetical protein
VTNSSTKSKEYRRLLDEFYEKNHEMVSAEDYQKAKEDPEYFKALVKRLTDLYQDMGRELVMEDNRNCGTGVGRASELGSGRAKSLVL